MKRLFYLLFTLFILSVAASGLKAQESQRSKTLISILGTKFYVHIVKPGETMASLCKIYNVTVQDIISFNPNLDNGLVVGDGIKILYVEEPKTISESADNYIYHTVQRKQTLFSIAKKYNVDEQEIIDLNPDVKEGLRSGMVLKIPNTLNGSHKSPDDEYVYHKVEPKETLFSLAQKYNVDMKDINAVNPDLKEGLKVGQTVKIPKGKVTSEMIADAKKNESQNTERPCEKFKYDPSVPFKVALLLPLFINDNYDRSSESNERPEKWFYKNSVKFYEFYEGALMSIDALRKQGMTVDLHVYDAQNDASKIQAIINKPELANMDIIIGPVYSETIKLVADFAKEHKINMISPLSQNDEIVKYNPYIFQVNPSNDIRIQQMAKYIASQSQSSVVAITSGTAEEAGLIDVCRRSLSGSYGERNAFKEINFKRSGISGLEDAMSVGLNNNIIVPSSSEVFVTDMVNKLYELSKTYNITLYGMPSWERFQNLDFNYLQKLNFHYSTGSYGNYTTWEVKNFVTKYREYYKTEPSVYSFQGYDIMNYFLGALKAYGKQFQYCLNESEKVPDKTGLLIDFDFKRLNSSGGYENRAVFIMQLDKDMSLLRVK